MNYISFFALLLILLANSVEAANLRSFTDTFDGTSIDTNRYLTAKRGSGSLTQNNGIIMIGDASNELLWNILYTKDDIDFTKNFTISVDVNFKEANVVRGDAMVIIGVEEKTQIVNAVFPAFSSFCEMYYEVGTGPKLRMENSIGQYPASVSLAASAGKLTATFNLDGGLTCLFESSAGNETLNRTEGIKTTGRYGVHLRGGVHTVDFASGKEQDGSAKFNVFFDNLKVTTALPPEVSLPPAPLPPPPAPAPTPPPAPLPAPTPVPILPVLQPPPPAIVPPRAVPPPAPAALLPKPAPTPTPAKPAPAPLPVPVLAPSPLPAPEPPRLALQVPEPAFPSRQSEVITPPPQPAPKKSAFSNLGQRIRSFFRSIFGR